MTLGKTALTQTRSAACRCFSVGQEALSEVKATRTAAGRCRVNPGSRGKLQAKSLLLVRTSGRALIRHLALSPQTSNNERRARQAQAARSSSGQFRPTRPNKKGTDSICRALASINPSDEIPNFVLRTLHSTYARAGMPASLLIVSGFWAARFANGRPRCRMTVNGSFRSPSVCRTLVHRTGQSSF